MIFMVACFSHRINKKKNTQKVIATFYLTILNLFLRIVRYKLTITRYKVRMRDINLQ